MKLQSEHPKVEQPASTLDIVQATTNTRTNSARPFFIVNYESIIMVVHRSASRSDSVFENNFVELVIFQVDLSFSSFSKKSTDWFSLTGVVTVFSPKITEQFELLCFYANLGVSINHKEVVVSDRSHIFDELKLFEVAEGQNEASFVCNLLCLYITLAETC